MKYLILLLGISFAVIAQILLKSLSLYTAYERKWLYIMAASIVSYGLAFLTQVYLYKLFQLHRISPIMAISIMILVVISSFFVFNEHIQLKQILGVVLGVISIYLILT
jgi:drug/metabolite transporter (DMT)-like permease